MITAWQVYWVMQLDDIRLFILLVFGGLIFGVIIFTPVWIVEKDWHAAVKRTVIGSLLMLFLLTFMPSSKTVATMIILPTITSDEVIDTVTPEAKELYGLAKDALKNLGAKDK